LKWEDVDWDKKRILVYSPKTEHHEGKEKRFIPLFPELVPILKEAQDLNQGVSRFVCGKVRSGTLNLRTGLLKTLKSLGIKPWPKLFVNLRSSRETELVERFPLHVVTEWIGHTPEIAAKHYLQVLEQHWACAAEESTSGFFAPRKLKE
ncbi:MAG: integrase, partial [Gemmataceae bacterium]